MNRLKAAWVWISRIGCCRGFGIQSPTDYAFVRYVVNEHWPYYAYATLKADDWLTQKKGRLMFRLANWRQPRLMAADKWQQWWQAGCRKTVFLPSIDDIRRVELAYIDIADTEAWQSVADRCNEQSVVVVDNIWQAPQRWHDIMEDSRTATTFDLYYCGIVFFDKQRYGRHYKINF